MHQSQISSLFLFYKRDYILYAMYAHIYTLYMINKCWAYHEEAVSKTPKQLCRINPESDLKNVLYSDWSSKVQINIKTLTDTAKLRPQSQTITKALCNAITLLGRLWIKLMSWIYATSEKKIRFNIWHYNIFCCSKTRKISTGESRHP